MKSIPDFDSKRKNNNNDNNNDDNNEDKENDNDNKNSNNNKNTIIIENKIIDNKIDGVRDNNVITL